MINTIENTEGALAIEDIIPDFVGEVYKSIPNSNFLKRIELTERDLKIIEFILEMKFSSTEEVFQKFFKLTRSNHESKSLAWPNVPLLPYAMIGKWNLQRNGKLANSDFPAIDLSNPQVQAMLSKLAAEKGSKEMANLAAEKTGLLVPTFERDSAFQDCFKYDVGLVEIDTTKVACKTIAQKYLATAKASADLSRRTTAVCKGDLIRFADSSMNFDPCAEPGTLKANALCTDSVPAYVRKLTKDPKTKEETHKKYLLENCQDEIKKLPKQYRYLFE